MSNLLEDAGIQVRLKGLFGGLDEACKGEGLIRTGLAILDDFGGIAPGEVIVLGGHTGVGKSWIANHVGLLAAQRGSRVLHLSFSEAPEVIARRMLTATAGVSVGRIRSGAMTRDDLTEMCQAAEDLTALGISIVGAGALDTLSVRGLIEEWRGDAPGTALVIVDDIQGVPSVQDLSTRDHELHRVMMSLNQTSVACGVGILAISQVNRRGQAKTPALSDLRGSGAIEGNCDGVILVDEDVEAFPGVQFELHHRPLRLDLVKHRNMPAGTSSDSQLVLLNLATGVVRLERTTGERGLPHFENSEE